MKNKSIFILMLVIGMLYFLLFAIPNSMGIQDEHMLSLLSQDESIQYPYLMHMLTQGSSLLETFKNFIAYQHYFYGYPFYLYSALILLPLRVVYGSQFSSMIGINLLLLRQLVSILPMLLATGILTYLHTRFESRWKSVLLFAFLLTIPAVLGNNLWFWHPDGMAVLGVALTLFFLDRDNFTFGHNFLFAALTCGFTAATKVIGFFFFLTIFLYLILAVVQKKVSLPKFFKYAGLFLLVFLLVFIFLNPLLLFAQSRTQILKVQSQQNYFVTHGWQDEDIYITGLTAWLPYLQQWYAYPMLLLLFLLCMLLAIWQNKQRLANLLTLTWLIPYSCYLIFFVAIKPNHYWLPVLLPLFACALSLVPPDFFTDRDSLHSDYLLSKFIFPLVLLSLIGFQLGRNLHYDTTLFTRYLEKERLLLACNSTPDNEDVGQATPLQPDRWYRLETFDERTSPPSRAFSVVSGTLTISAYEEYGENAWACSSQAQAAFSAERLARLYKESHPDNQVIGPDGQEITR